MPAQIIVDAPVALFYGRSRVANFSVSSLRRSRTGRSMIDSTASHARVLPLVGVPGKHIKLSSRQSNKMCTTWRDRSAEIAAVNLHK
jgi:hypothetical protein